MAELSLYTLSQEMKNYLLLSGGSVTGLLKLKDVKIDGRINYDDGNNIINYNLSTIEIGKNDIYLYCDNLIGASKDSNNTIQNWTINKNGQGAFKSLIIDDITDDEVNGNKAVNKNYVDNKIEDLNINEGYSELTNLINQNKSETDNAIQNLNNNLSNEITNRENADSSLSNRIDEIYSTISDDIDKVEEALSGEVSRATNAEEGLQEQIEELSSAIVSGTIVVDAELKEDSKNPVQNQVIKKELDNKLSLSGGTMTGSIDMGEKDITNINSLAMSNGLIIDDERNINLSGNDGTGGDITGVNEITATTFNGNLDGNANTATNATNIHVTVTDPNNTLPNIYYIPLYLENSEGNKSLLSNNGISYIITGSGSSDKYSQLILGENNRYGRLKLYGKSDKCTEIINNSDNTSGNYVLYTPNTSGYIAVTTEHTGTSSSEGYSVLTLGNSIESGTDGNKYGKVRLYTTSSGYVDLVTTSSTSDYTVTFPSSTGTVAVICEYEGTNGYSVLSLGNNISKNNSGSKYGIIQIYNSLKGCTNIVGTDDNLSYTITMPNKTGTMALIDDLENLNELNGELTLDPEIFIKNKNSTNGSYFGICNYGFGSEQINFYENGFFIREYNSSGSFVRNLIEIRTSHSYIKTELGFHATGELLTNSKVYSMALELFTNSTSSNIGGYIDFHYNQTINTDQTAGDINDYTTRVMENAQGELNISANSNVNNGIAKLKVNSKRVYAVESITNTEPQLISDGCIVYVY